MEQRVILFRGISKKTGEFIYGMPTHDLTHIFNSEQMDSPDNYEIISETVGQFTGLKDKNRVKICDGDVIDYENLLGDMQRGFISFRDGSFRVLSKLNIVNLWEGEIRMWNDGNNEWYSIENLESFNIEVIGNLHQAPELLN